MSPILTKILVIVGAAAALVALVFIIYTQHELKVQQTAIQTQIVQQQQLVDGIVRSQSQWATKDDMTKFAADNNINLKAIQDNLKQLNAQVSSINVITAGSTGQVATNLPSTSTGNANPNPTPTATCKDGTPCPDQDVYGYQKKEQDLALNENFTTVQVPIGKVGFSAWQKDPWNVNISPREYNVDTVVGVDENQRQTFYNKFTVKVDNKSYDIPIKTATTKQQYPKATFSFWNPRLLMGLDGGVNVGGVKAVPISGEFTPSLSVGIMSYGQYKTTPDLSVLEVGLAYGTVNKTPGIIITPIAYNFGKNLFSPFMNNTYIGPSVMIATDGSFTVGAGIRVGF